MLIMNMVIGTDDLHPNLQIRTNFVPTLKFAPIFMKFGTPSKKKHANYEYNTCHGLERLRDYWLRMILGCKIQLAFRT